MEATAIDSTQMFLKKIATRVFFCLQGKEKDKDDLQQGKYWIAEITVGPRL